MTPAEHAQRIRQLALELYKADNGMALPRDAERVRELRIAMAEAMKEAELDLILSEFER